MNEIKYFLINCNKRRNAEKGRALCGPIERAFLRDSVIDHVPRTGEGVNV
ncbi:MAG: hypothetical protein LBT16_07690 [Treponema sp.]|nr:hypothetical protein [Treponema sp.]